MITTILDILLQRLVPLLMTSYVLSCRCSSTTFWLYCGFHRRVAGIQVQEHFTNWCQTCIWLHINQHFDNDSTVLHVMWPVSSPNSTHSTEHYVSIKSNRNHGVCLFILFVVLIIGMKQSLVLLGIWEFLLGKRCCHNKTRITLYNYIIHVDHCQKIL